MLPIGVERDDSGCTLCQGILKPAPQAAGLSEIVVIAEQRDLQAGEYGGGVVGGSIIHDNHVAALLLGSRRHVMDGGCFVVGGNDDPVRRCDVISMRLEIS